MDKLSVIIVNYRASAFIVDAIASAMSFPSGKDFEWIVVDNDSGDDSSDRILSRFPFVHFIQMGYNAGFARANNAGIRQATGNVVLLLNPDTLVLDDAIDRCFRRLVSRPAVACSVQLLNPDGSEQISGNYFMTGGINHLLPLPYYGALLKRLALVIGTKTPHLENTSTEARVDWINGAFLMVKQSAIAAAGLMDEDFFLFAEETEWCSRLGKSGDLLIFGDIRMIHLQGEVTNESTGAEYKGYNNLFDRKGLQLMVSNHLRIRKQYGVGWFLFQLINVSIGVAVFAVCSVIDQLVHGRSPGRDAALVRGLARNVRTLWRLTPRIIRNEPHFYKVM